MSFSLSRRNSLKLAAATVSSIGTLTTFAQSFPTRPIELIVPYPPGGSTDVIARLLSAKLTPLLGQPVIIENRGGASGNIAATYVALSPSDGHRLLMGANAIVSINPHIFKNVGFDPLKDLAPVSQICNGALAVAVNADSNIHTLASLVTAAKHASNGFFYATPSAGTPQHLMGEQLADAAGVPLTPVHYKGVAPALNDVLAKNVPMLFSSYAVLKPHVDAGKLRVLAVGTKERIAIAPHIPTIAETYPGFEATLWFGIFATGGTPSTVIEKLQRAISQVVADKEAQYLLNSLALPPVGGNSSQLAQLLNRDYENFRHIIRNKKITAD